MDVLFSSFTGYCGCDVWRFTPGSIVTELVLIFSDSSAVSQSALLDQILNSVNPADNTLHNLVLENLATTTVTGKWSNTISPSKICVMQGVSVTFILFI